MSNLPPINSAQKTVLLTVGATFPFPSLTTTILTPSLLTTLSSLGYTQLRIQHGQTPDPLLSLSNTTQLQSPISIATFPFTSTLSTEISQASLVISHSGSGSILDVLRLVKRLVVVPNEELMDNHQVELAEELERQGYLVHGRLCSLAEDIKKAETANFKHFPRSGSERFVGIVDQEMGFEAEG